jgi:hypothetical protein
MIAKGAVAEKQLTQYCKSSESGVVRLAWTACKALGRNGDKKKGGAYLGFCTFVKNKMAEKMRLTSFRGNRFNVLFLLSALIFYYHQSIEEFLKYNNSNLLLKQS